MALSAVHLTSDVYLVCLQHAFTTDNEEIMGLLIGENDEKNRIVTIHTVKMLIRSDKQPDRVEISPEQLIAAEEYAESCSRKTGRRMCIIGWYHSHPKITVWPSHVDLRTQAQYQMLSRTFVGLIFSVFDVDKTTKQQKVQMTCFQSINQSPESEPPQYERLEIPIKLVPAGVASHLNLEAMAQLAVILHEEEEYLFKQIAAKADNMDLITELHNSAVYARKISRLLELTSAPLLQTIENSIQQNTMLEEDYKREREELMLALKKFDGQTVILNNQDIKTKESSV